ncbi:MAG TPA: hypothetical protein VFN39_12750 [Gemmatimonadaceae bacterium]|nr:hypothetical protein [Gemmatimonadaceae bacterium]
MRSIRSTSKAAAHFVAIAAALAASSLASPSLAAAQDSAAAPATVAAVQPVRAVATDKVAAQLGAKLANAQPADLVIGASATAILSDPARLAALGLRDAKAGSRVTIMRSARDRVRVEVDEFEPVVRTRRLALHLDPDGRVSLGTP